MKKNSSISAALSVFAFLAIAVALPSHATLISLSAILDGNQEVPSVVTNATGSATMLFDDNTNEFSWEISWTDLSGPATAAHFHGPAGPGTNASVQVTITDLTSTSVGNTTLNAGQAADLLAGLWYINIHTVANSGGEIRGQVTRVTEPGTSSLLLLSFAGLLYLRRKRV